MSGQESKYEIMRKDPANWKLGFVYFCADDPRVIVRQRLLFGWTWNFANAWVLPAIVAAVAIFLGPVGIAWYFGTRSAVHLVALVVLSLCVVMLLAHRLARDPSSRS